MTRTNLKQDWLLLVHQLPPKPTNLRVRIWRKLQKRGGHLSIGRLRNYEAELDKLHKELERIISTDFYQTSGRAVAVIAYERCQKALLASQNRKSIVASTPSNKAGSLHLEQFQGKR